MKKNLQTIKEPNKIEENTLKFRNLGILNEREYIKDNLNVRNRMTGKNKHSQKQCVIKRKLKPSIVENRERISLILLIRI